MDSKDILELRNSDDDETDIVCVPVDICTLAVMALAHASMDNEMYAKAYEKLSAVVDQFRKSAAAEIDRAAPKD